MEWQPNMYNIKECKFNSMIQKYMFVWHNSVHIFIVGPPFNPGKFHPKPNTCVRLTEIVLKVQFRSKQNVTCVQWFLNMLKIIGINNAIHLIQHQMIVVYCVLNNTKWWNITRSIEQYFLEKLSLKLDKLQSWQWLVRVGNLSEISLWWRIWHFQQE